MGRARCRAHAAGQRAVADRRRGCRARSDLGRRIGGAAATPRRSPAAPSHALEDVAEFDARLEATIESLRGAEAQLRDAAHTLASYLDRTELDPERLRALDERLSAWIGLARRYRRPPAELPGLLADWKVELRALDAASDLEALRGASDAARKAYDAEAKRVSAARRGAAPKLAAAVTRSMQQLGMAGGQFEVALEAGEAPQSFGLESASFLVAGHAGTTPRPLGKIASGGELSRIALSVAVVTSELDTGSDAPGTLIFDEVDAGIGGAVAETVGRLMKQLGRERQVLAVTHLPQVAACADHHLRRLQAHRGRQDAQRRRRRWPANRASPRSRACSAAKSSRRRASRTRRKCCRRAPRSAPRPARKGAP